MKALALLLVGCAAAGAPRYPLHPALRSASGGPIVVVGDVEHVGEIPYSRGITLSAALRLAGGPKRFARRARIQRMERGVSHSFTVPLRAVLAGAAPDPELAPGDVVSIPLSID